MGNEESRPEDECPAYDDAEEQSSKYCPNPTEGSIPVNDAYAAVHFRSWDEVYVMWGDAEMRQIMKKHLSQYIGVNSSEMYEDGIFFIKMKGYPFLPGQVGSQAAATLKRAGAEVLRELFTVGWILVCTSNLTRVNSGSWFFRKVSIGKSIFGSVDERCLQPHSFPILSASSTDKLHILNFPEYPVLVQVITDSYPKGIQKVSEGDGFEIKLNGRPWETSGETKTEGVVLIMRLMATIEQRGYGYYGRADFKGTPDTLFFVPIVGQNKTPVEDYMAVTMDDTDDLRVYQASEYIICAIGSQVVNQWVGGVQNEGPHRGGYEWKLCGDPWWSTGGQAVSARMMMIALFDVLWANRYEHYVTLDLSRSLMHKSTILFRLNRQTVRRREFAAISPSWSGWFGLVRLVGFPGHGPEYELVVDAINKAWPKGIHDLSWNHGTQEIKLGSTPFSESVFPWKSECYARTMMCAVMAALNNVGWEVVSSCNVSAKYHSNAHYPIGLDVWFVARATRLATESAPAAPAAPEPGGAPPSYAPTAPAAPEPGGAPPSYDEAVARMLRFRLRDKRRGGGGLGR